VTIQNDSTCKTGALKIIIKKKEPCFILDSLLRFGIRELSASHFALFPLPLASSAAFLPFGLIFPTSDVLKSV